MFPFHRERKGSPARRTPASPLSSSDEQLRVELGVEVLVQRGQAVIMRGRPGRRRVLVIADDRVAETAIARELRDLADCLAPIEAL